MKNSIILSVIFCSSLLFCVRPITPIDPNLPLTGESWKDWIVMPDQFWNNDNTDNVPALLYINNIDVSNWDIEDPILTYYQIKYPDEDSEIYEQYKRLRYFIAVIDLENAYIKKGYTTKSVCYQGSGEPDYAVQNINLRNEFNLFPPEVRRVALIVLLYSRPDDEQRPYHGYSDYENRENFLISLLNDHGVGFPPPILSYKSSSLNPPEVSINQEITFTPPRGNGAGEGGFRFLTENGIIVAVQSEYLQFKVDSESYETNMIAPRVHYEVQFTDNYGPDFTRDNWQNLLSESTPIFTGDYAPDVINNPAVSEIPTTFNITIDPDWRCPIEFRPGRRFAYFGDDESNNSASSEQLWLEGLVLQDKPHLEFFFMDFNNLLNDGILQGELADGDSTLYLPVNELTECNFYIRNDSREIVENVRFKVSHKQRYWEDPHYVHEHENIESRCEPEEFTNVGSIMPGRIKKLTARLRQDYEYKRYPKADYCDWELKLDIVYPDENGNDEELQSGRYYLYFLDTNPKINNYGYPANLLDETFAVITTTDTTYHMIDTTDPEDDWSDNAKDFFECVTATEPLIKVTGTFMEHRNTNRLHAGIDLSLPTDNGISTVFTVTSGKIKFYPHSDKYLSKVCVYDFNCDDYNERRDSNFDEDVLFQFVHINDLFNFPLTSWIGNKFRNAGTPIGISTDHIHLEDVTYDDNYNFWRAYPVSLGNSIPYRVNPLRPGGMGEETSDLSLIDTWTSVIPDSDIPIIDTIKLIADEKPDSVYASTEQDINIIELENIDPAITGFDIEAFAHDPRNNNTRKSNLYKIDYRLSRISEPIYNLKDFYPNSLMSRQYQFMIKPKDDKTFNSNRVAEYFYTTNLTWTGDLLTTIAYNLTNEPMSHNMNSSIPRIWFFNGDYQIEVQAFDASGNPATSALDFTVIGDELAESDI